MPNTQKPDYQAYTVIKRDGQDDYWLNIGAAFRHQKGDGLNVLLQALPIDGKLVLRPPKEQPGESQREKGTRQSIRREKQ